MYRLRISVFTLFAIGAAQIFALWYGFSPEPEKTMKVLMDEFSRHNRHVSTGIFSTKMMFDVLREEDLNGEDAVS